MNTTLTGKGLLDALATSLTALLVKVYTQVYVLGKTLHVIIGIFTAASVLMLFEEVRQFGTSILASAGVVGIILRFAAQRTIANLFAGFQLAMTQPIRLDDVVIVEGEWGRIEEITLTYVVIHIWDDRRLVVPLSYFIEIPFPQRDLHLRSGALVLPAPTGHTPPTSSPSNL